MRRFTAALTGAVTASVAAGCAGTGAPVRTGHGRFTRCAADALVLRTDAGVVPMTGEHAVLYELANRGRGTCTVRGYPQVTLYDANGRALASGTPMAAAHTSPPASRRLSCSHMQPWPTCWSPSTGPTWGSHATRPRSG